MKRSRQVRAVIIAVCIGVMSWMVAVYPQSGGQAKPAPGLSDYGQWERIAGFNLSPDGLWLAYGINRSNGTNELRVKKLSDGETKTVAFGTQMSFSADSKWIAYSI